MDKQKQKQLITEIMKSDEEQGLYEHPMTENKTKSAEEILEASCESVVNGYEMDGMEQMGVRDEVFYNTCKKAMEEYHNQFATPQGYTREHLTDLVQQLMDYTKEGHVILGHDEREPSEFVDIFIASLTPSKEGKG